MQCPCNPTHWKMGHGKIACSVLPNLMLDGVGNVMLMSGIANDEMWRKAA